MMRVNIEGKHPTVWFTGHSWSGKTTRALELQEALKVPSLIIDGDDMRASISQGAGFSPEEREAHNLRCARLARELSKQMIVVVAVIAPQRSVRKKIDDICNPLWVLCEREVPEREGHWYEMPEAVEGYRLSLDEILREVVCTH